MRAKLTIERVPWTTSVTGDINSQCFAFPHEFSRSRPSSRILARLEDEGWADELNTYPSVYDGLRNQPGVGMSKALTDKGALVNLRVHTRRD